MNISIESSAGLCQVGVEGEMTIYTAAELKSEIVPLLLACEKMEVSLANVSEIDAAGLQVLALLKREAGAIGKPISFIAHSQSVLEVLDLCDLAGVFGDPLVISTASE
jgi:anti-sigma B factor antagonist